MVASIIDPSGVLWRIAAPPTTIHVMSSTPATQEQFNPQARIEGISADAVVIDQIERMKSENCRRRARILVVRRRQEHRRY